jgi:hypothetical protein
MLTKAWRIFKIFENTNKIKKVIIRDVHLVGCILCIVAFDVAVLAVWQAVDGVHIKPRHIIETHEEPTKITMVNRFSLVAQQAQQQRFYHLPSSNQTNRLFNGTVSSSTPPVDLLPPVVVQNVGYKNEIKVLYECNSNFNEVWISVLTIYKIVLLMYGIYLAWLIRNINVPSMNDSKYLILSTYVIIVCGLGSMTLMQVG